MRIEKNKISPTPPRLDPTRLRSAEVIRLVEEWIEKHYVPQEDYVEDAHFGNNPLIRDDDESASYSTWTILETAFGDTLDAGNLAAISELLSYKSPRWVRRGAASRRANDRLSPSPDEADRTHGRSPEEIITAAHLSMLVALQELEEALQGVAPFSSKMGDNNPSEDIGVPPYTDEDERNIRAAISTLRSSPALPAPVPSQVENAVETIDRKAMKFSEYAGTLGDISARKFADEIGKMAAKAVVVTSVWEILGTKLMQAAETAYHWLEALTLFG